MLIKQVLKSGEDLERNLSGIRLRRSLLTLILHVGPEIAKRLALNNIEILRIIQRLVVRYDERAGTPVANLEVALEITGQVLVIAAAHIIDLQHLDTDGEMRLFIYSLDKLSPTKLEERLDRIAELVVILNVIHFHGIVFENPVPSEHLLELYDL